MGGSGSGRKVEDSGRRTTHDLPALDVRALKKEGSVVPRQEYLQGVARLKWTPCNFGGERPWFICPGEECDQRAAILYREGEGSFLCRVCLNLTYSSQRKDRLSRARRRALKIRMRLGTDLATRPKGMHRTTFARLSREYLKAYQEHVTLYNERFAKLMERPSERNFRLIRQMEWERIEHNI